MYNVTVNPVNEAGLGKAANVLFFSKQGMTGVFLHAVKSIANLDIAEPPKGVTATVSNDKKFINISWNYTSFSDAGGFFVYNVTVAAPTQSPYSKILSYNVTSVSVPDPIPNVLYTVTVGYIVYDGGDVAGPVATTSVVMVVSTSSPSSGGLNIGMLHLIIITLITLFNRSICQCCIFWCCHNFTLNFAHLHHYYCYYVSNA